MNDKESLYVFSIEAIFLSIFDPWLIESADVEPAEMHGVQTKGSERWWKGLAGGPTTASAVVLSLCTQKV
jgi:hypothetical protein